MKEAPHIPQIIKESKLLNMHLETLLKRKDMGTPTSMTA